MRNNLTPQQFESIIDSIKALHIAKNKDYGSNGYLSDILSSSKIGIEPWKNCLMRIQQKVGRLESFAVKGAFEVKDEKFTDTCLDGAVYFIIMSMLYTHGKQSSKINRRSRKN
tara:strand:- start:627 stop:965 length:339 start_codon:yes stop_codon:yes gene_type:complete